ncbi:hyaluronidase-like [Sphaerodactylus townsendi]|uniref:hyaluronidase-like n=1 Tax=Sphaerodactylus townsendi TaxID=933632 RepID=UPI002025F125|nr:hyaluronidase-like [Sphaerodactylus townsendi]
MQTSAHFRLHRSFCCHTVLLLLWLCPDLLAASHQLKPSLPPLVASSPFLVVWNAPTARCSAAHGVPLYLDSYNILVNSQEAFAGGNITIFYHNQLGLYPYYVNSVVTPTAVNGGCPQNASLEKHLQKMRVDIAKAMPFNTFSDLSVIDWEDWRPQWIRNWGSKKVYRNMSFQLDKQRYPGLSEGEIQKKAKLEFETAAKEFMSETLHLAESLRPNGLWGYYLFPECYNYDYLKDFNNFTGNCPSLEKQRNNNLKWLWERTRALFPSIYMEEVLRSSVQGKKFVQGKVGEALRVAVLNSHNYSVPIFAYARPFYTYTMKELTQTDLAYTIGQAAAMGVHGVVLWGGADYSRDRATCSKLQDYLRSTLGPYIVNVTLATKLCSQLFCNNNGRCIRRRMVSDTYLHLNPQSFQIRADTGGNQIRVSVTGILTDQQKYKMGQEFTCHCYQGWEGDDCHPHPQGRGLSLQTGPWCITGAVLLALSVWLL